MFDAFLQDFHLPKLRERDDLWPTPQYPSGLDEKDNTIYKYALESTANPNIAIPYILHDNNTTLEPGYYELALSNDKRYLLLIQSRSLKAMIPAIRVVVKEETNSELSRLDDEFGKRAEKARKQNRKTKAKKLETELKDIKQLEMSARIKDEGNYYLIEYNKENVWAWGYIAK